MLVLILDADGRIAACNGACEAAMAAPASALRGRVLWECPTFEGMRRSIQDGLASLANGSSAVTMESAAPAGGGWRVALDSSILAKRGCGQVLCTAVPSNGVAAAEGSTAMDQADEIANHWMATFAANMSHEVRTPLNAIVGFSDILKQELYGPLGEKYRAAAADIQTGAGHLLQLIDDIVDLSKAGSGSLELHEESVDFAEPAAAAISMLRQSAEAAGVALATDLPPDLPGLRADPRKLRQILINLIANAIKFTAESGRITIAATAADGFTVTVSDTGIGMARREAPAAAALQGSDVAAVRARGTGIGIPLVKSLVALHGGTIAFSSEPNVGTTVSIRFPADRVLA